MLALTMQDPPSSNGKEPVNTCISLTSYMDLPPFGVTVVILVIMKYRFGRKMFVFILYYNEILNRETKLGFSFLVSI